MLWILIRIISAWRGDSDEYPQLMFLWRTHEKLSFNYHQIPTLSVPLYMVKPSLTTSLMCPYLKYLTILFFFQVSWVREITTVLATLVSGINRGRSSLLKKTSRISAATLAWLLYLDRARVQRVWVYICCPQDQSVREPPHDKTNKMACAPSDDSDQPGHSPSLIRVFAIRMKKAWVHSYPLSAQRRLWSDWADAQADLSHHWAHMPFLIWVFAGRTGHIVGFVMTWLKLF